MKVIPPLAITDAMLTSSTAAEPAAGETAWVSGATYAVGDVCILTSTHRKYERLVAGAGTTSPDLDLANWEDIGPTNKWAMFDLMRNTATELASPLTVVIAPGRRISAIGLVGLVADQVQITMESGASVIYDVSEYLLLRHSTTWSEYYFGEFRNRSAVVKFDLPQATGAVVTVTLTRVSGAVKCGGLVIGTSVDLGTVEKSAVSDSTNFSKIDRDAFGNATLRPRRTIPQTDQQLFANKARINKLREVREDLNATPALWSGLDDAAGNDYFETLLILGIYKRFAITLEDVDLVRVSLQLEEI